MTPTCTPRVVDLCRTCRLHISWPVTGVDATSQVALQLDAGPWHSLVLAPDFRTVVGYFAGPDFAEAGLAVAVPATSCTRVRIMTPSESLIFPGGFIRLTR